MANEKLVRIGDIFPNNCFYVNGNDPMKSLDELISRINNAPAADVIAVDEIEAYLQARLDEWNALGDRKWEPANMWGYNFIMACFDDLERRKENKTPGLNNTAVKSLVPTDQVSYEARIIGSESAGVAASYVDNRAFGENIPQAEDSVKRKKMPQHPCIGCVYYKVCGESTRTAPCYGRMTKRESNNAND